jgi:hypothetical protein
MIRHQLRSAADQLKRHAVHGTLVLWNRTSQAVSQMKTRLANPTLGDHNLATRIRSRIARRVANPDAVTVRATGGRVVLCGLVHADQIDDLLRCAWSVPGVHELTNQLQALQEPDHLPGEQRIETQSPSQGMPLAPGLIAPQGEIGPGSRIPPHRID